MATSQDNNNLTGSDDLGGGDSGCSSRGRWCGHDEYFVDQESGCDVVVLVNGGC